MRDTLTKHQQELIETNHDLIYWFANKFNLEINDYYDILAIGLCYAAKAYDENKCEFSTFAFYCMRNEVYQYWRSRKLKCVIPEEMILSCDFTYNTDSEGCENNLLNMIADNHQTEDLVMSRIMPMEFIDSLKNKEKIIAELLINGSTQAEVAKKLCCSRQNVSIIVQRIQKKCIKYMGI